MSFMRNIAPPYRDKKIEHLCYVIFRSCVSILINTKGCQPYNVLSCKNFHRAFSSWDVVNQSSTSCKTPTLFSWTIFLIIVLMLNVMLLFLCLSGDLLSSLFWSMHIKTQCSIMKSYHCLKYSPLECTVVSL